MFSAFLMPYLCRYTCGKVANVKSGYGILICTWLQHYELVTVINDSNALYYLLIDLRYVPSTSQ